MLIVLPLPPAALSPNARVHWATRHVAAKRYRQDAGLVAKTTMRALGLHPAAPWACLYIWPTFYFGRNQRRDKDNLLAMLKPALDGLADAGLVADDRHITPMPVVIRIDSRDPRVELECLPEESSYDR